MSNLSVSNSEWEDEDAVLAAAVTVVSVTDTLITINIDLGDASTAEILLAGNFTGLSGVDISNLDGTITGVTLSVDAVQQFTATGLTIPASAISVDDFTDFKDLLEMAFGDDEDGSVMDGSDDNDTLDGHGGDDDLNGGGGSDDLNGGDGDDSLDGGDGDDDLDGGIGDDILLGGIGDDILNGGMGDDTLNGGAGDDAMNGGAGDDTYMVNSAGDTITDASGIDTEICSLSTVLKAFIENLILTGGARNGTGNGLSNDLTGNALANTLIGGGGNDDLDGGGGNDHLVGGTGNDTYVVNAVGDVVTETSGQGTDTERSSISDTLDSNVENLVLTGSAALNGTGNALNNVISGNSGSNRLGGGEGADRLHGAGGNDFLNGGNGNDTLTGGAGKDSLTGGAGHDVFDFNTLAEMGSTSGTADIIVDFQHGLDDIDLSTIDANTATGANDAFTKLLTRGDFTAAGQLKYVGGVLYGNTDSDSAPEFAIALTGSPSLTTSDLIL